MKLPRHSRWIWLAVALALAACTTVSPPMHGRCTEILPDHYDGEVAEGPTLRCVWQSRTWECTALSGRWVCNATGPAPAEEPGK